jgi:hypothetical protein
VIPFFPFSRPVSARMNAINYGKLKIQAKIGELSPALPPGERGQGRNGKKSAAPGAADFASATIAKYRKVAKNIGKLDDYRQTCSNGEPQADYCPAETSLSRGKRCDLSFLSISAAIAAPTPPLAFLEIAFCMPGNKWSALPAMCK